MEKVNVVEKFAQITEHWSPKIVGELNGQYVKFAKVQGEFVWHQHDNEDEMFFVVDGTLHIEFRDKTVTLEKNNFLIIPRGVEHRPFAENEVLLMLFEPASTLHTGETVSELTKNEQHWI